MTKKRNWIQKAVELPGALREKAKKKGLVKKGYKLSQDDLNKMKKTAKKKGDMRTERQINLAETLKKMRKKK